MFDEMQALAPNYIQIRGLGAGLTVSSSTIAAPTATKSGAMITWAVNLAHLYVDIKDRGGVLPLTKDYFNAKAAMDYPKATGIEKDAAYRAFQDEIDRMLGTGQPTFDVAQTPTPAPSGSATQSQIDKSSAGAAAMAQSYGDFMREAGEWLKLAGMPTTALTAGGGALTTALTQAKNALKARLMSVCGDSSSQADTRIANGPASVRSRLSTCQSAKAAAAAATQMAAQAGAAQAAAAAEAAKLTAAEQELQKCAGMSPSETAALRAKGPTFLYGTLYNKCQRQTAYTVQPTITATTKTKGTSAPLDTTNVVSIQPTQPDVSLTPPATTTGFPWKLALAGAAGLGGLALLIALLARKKKG